MTDFVKRNPDAPSGFLACEAAGLRWLAAAGGAACVPGINCSTTSLTLEHLDYAAPYRRAAADFGARLAVTHDGCSRIRRRTGPLGRIRLLRPAAESAAHVVDRAPHLGEFYADERLGPMGERAAPRPAAASREALAAVRDLCPRAGSTTVTRRRGCTVICGAET